MGGWGVSDPPLLRGKWPHPCSRGSLTPQVIVCVCVLAAAHGEAGVVSVPGPATAPADAFPTGPAYGS